MDHAIKCILVAKIVTKIDKRGGIYYSILDRVRFEYVNAHCTWITGQSSLMLNLCWSEMRAYMGEWTWCVRERKWNLGTRNQTGSSLICVRLLCPNTQSKSVSFIQALLNENDRTCSNTYLIYCEIKENVLIPNAIIQNMILRCRRCNSLLIATAGKCDNNYAK